MKTNSSKGKSTSTSETSLYLALPRRLHAKLKREAEKRDMSLRGYILAVLRDHAQ